MRPEVEEKYEYKILVTYSNGSREDGDGSFAIMTLAAFRRFLYSLTPVMAGTHAETSVVETFNSLKFKALSPEEAVKLKELLGWKPEQMCVSEFPYYQVLE